MSAPFFPARSANSRIFLALPERSPTVQLIWPIAMRMAATIASASCDNENTLRHTGPGFARFDSRFGLGRSRGKSSAAFARVPARTARKRLCQRPDRLGAQLPDALAGWAVHGSH